MNIDNNVLGIKIVRNHAGFTTLFECNSNSILNENIEDIRELLLGVNNLDKNNVVLMLSCLDQGHLLTMATLLGGVRGDESISAWIFIPNHIKITGKQIVEVVDVTRRELLATQRNDDKLIELFSRKYEASPAKLLTSKYTSEKVAFRNYGIGTLYSLGELLNDRCQKYYKDYKRIFLIEKSSALSYRYGDDLTNQSVIAAVVAEPPVSVNSFMPYVDNKPFTDKVCVMEGETIEIEWRRDGYKSITTTTIVKRDSASGYTLPKDHQFIKVLPYSTICVFNEENRPIEKYLLSVGGMPVNEGDDIEIRESLIKSAEVKIVAEGYKTLHENVDLSQPVKLNMKKQVSTYEFYIPRRQSNSYLRVDVNDLKDVYGSPIKGYKLKSVPADKHKTNYLVFQPFNRKFWVVFGITLLVVLLLGFWAGFAVSSSISKENASTQTTQPTYLAGAGSQSQPRQNAEQGPKGGPAPDAVAFDTAAAIAYLDTNNVWNKLEMEKYEDLKGLWDALNERRFEDVLKYCSKLETSSTFQELIKVINNNKHKTINGAYITDPNDFDITIKSEDGTRGYLKSLENAEDQAKKTSNKKTTADPGKDKTKSNDSSKTQNGDKKSKLTQSELL